MRGGERGWSMADQYATTILQMGGAVEVGCEPDNLHWILDQVGPDEKVIIYAHNGHVGAHDWENRRRCGLTGERLRQIVRIAVAEYWHGLLRGFRPEAAGKHLYSMYRPLHRVL
jgi:hypothetical protein